MDDKWKERIAQITAILLAASLFCACAADGENGVQQVVPETEAAGADAALLSTGVVGVEEDAEYGNVLIELSVEQFNALGFRYGDSVDARFSNGYALEDVPYYTGYYTQAGDPLIVDFSGSDDLIAAINYGTLWDAAGLSDRDTVEITLHQAGKYLAIQEAMNLTYSDDRDDYASDEVFANFRSVHAGRVKENTIYRSASPCDNQHNRAPYTDALARDAGVKTIIDLAVSEAEIDGFMSSDDFDSPFFASLYKDGAVIPVNLQVDYTSDDYKTALIEALRQMSEREGPYLIHCLEGKDRTGFVCLLLEALTGAGYDELEKDYMISYDNYYGVDQQSEPEKYDTIVNNNLLPMLGFLAGADKDANISSADFMSGAGNYLLSGGMTAEEINALKERLER